MPKEEWGVKRICPTTGKRFYDLNKSPVVSPYTGEVVDLDTARRKTSVQEAKPVAKVKDDKVVADDLDTEDDLLVEEDEDVEVDEDLLEDDDDDSVSLDDIADVSGEDDES